MLHAAKSYAKHFVRDAIGPFVASRQPMRVDLDHALWNLEIGPNGQLRRTVDLSELLARFGSPLQVVDGPALDAVALEALAPLRAGQPAADVFFSYKTNPVPGVLSRLHSHGIGAEVISPFELWLAFRLGVAPERIIYNGPAKSFASLCDAIDAGILIINANSVGEVAVIRRAAEAVGRSARIGLRIALPSMWGGQFGLRAGSAVIPAIVGDLERDAHIELAGLHFHRGFPLRYETELDGYVGEVLSFCDQLRATTGWHPSILDLGGSLACPTVASIPRREFRMNRALGTDVLPPDPSSCLRVGQASGLIGAHVARHFDDAGLEEPRVVLEPGRAITAGSQMLLTTVIDVKTDASTLHAVLDAGINIAEPASTEFHQLFSVTSPEAAHDTSYRLVGPICTPADVIYNNWRLPRLEPGHVLAIMDSGAYFVPFSTSFSFPRPAIVIQDGFEIRVVREEETFDDMVGKDIATCFDVPPSFPST